MSLAPGIRFGSYQVGVLLGAGGMGEVYRATDTRLGRDVALKVLPAGTAHDPERLARFEREARLLASLNHPHIAQVYGFEHAALPDGSTAHFLAMELVEGDDLSTRLQRGAVPVDEALAIARQIVEALEEAHEKGIVHRDLKPANIKVGADGKVKVLDFGLAKLWASDTTSGLSAPDPSSSPTMAYGGTAAGLILGTAAYMAPEQARGRPVDKRADIWAFGVVCYEMLTGRRLFEGESVSDVLAGVLTREPDWSALPADTPARVRALIARCLVRDPRQRLRDIGDARWELHEGGRIEATVEARPAPRRIPAWVPWAGMLAAAVLALWASATRSPAAPPAGDGHFAIVLPDEVPLVTSDEPRWSEGPLAVSPDGRLLAYIAPSGYEDLHRSPDGSMAIITIEESGPSSPAHVWLADTGRGTVTRFTFDGQSRDPVWSPDGRFIDFGSKRGDDTFGLYVQPVDGRSPAELVWASPRASWPDPQSWTPDGRMIVFTTKGQDTSDDIWTRSLDDGTARPWLATPAAEWARRLSPDGRWMAYNSKESGRDEVYVQPYPGPGAKRLVSTGGGMNAIWSRDGRELFYRGGDALVAVTVETEPAFTVGPPTTLFSGRYRQTGRDFDISPDGTRFLMMRSMRARTTTRLDVRLNWWRLLETRLQGTR